MNFRGQFFSPDLVVALVVFVFSLVVFFSASESLYSQASLFDSRKGVDETAHKVMLSLLLSSGSPSNWENLGLENMDSFGLVSSNNVIFPAKIAALLNDLNDSGKYSIVKSKLGVGPYDILVRLKDSSGNAIYSGGENLEGGREANNPKIKFVYRRAVLFESSTAFLEGVFSLEK